MGPRPDGRGRWHSGRVEVPLPCASMGPRPDGRGRPRPARPTRSGTCVNGAAAGWPRKVQWHKPLAVAAPAASMGPRPDGRGRPSHRRRPDPAHLASMGPRPDGRGRCGDRQEGGREHDASMGPRPDGRGRRDDQAGPLSARRGVNGAAAGWPRKEGASLASSPVLARQWGRGRMAAEGGRPRPAGSAH